MKRFFFFAALVLTAGFFPSSTLAKGPQPTLPTIELDVAGISVKAEVADTDETRQTGMMFRTEMGENEGMLFVMDAPDSVGFWMKNTLIPLSIAYIGMSGVILEIHEMKPHDETLIESKFSTIKYALEMPGGWFTKQGIRPGAKIDGLPE